MIAPPNDARRRLLALGAATAAAAFFGRTVDAFASVDDVEAAIAGFAGAAAEDAAASPLTLYLPEIAENGSSVPVRLHVPADADGTVRALSVLLLAPDNPDPKIALWHFTPLSGSARVAIRIRLARSQRVVAVAIMSDGTWRQSERAVQVTIGGCGLENAGQPDGS